MKKKSQGVSSQWASQAFFNPRAILCIFVLMPQIFSAVKPASLMHVCLIRLQGFESATQNAFTRLCRSKGGWTRIFSVQRLSRKISIFVMVMLEFLRNGQEYQETVWSGLQEFKSATQNVFTGLCRSKGDLTRIFNLQIFRKISIFLMFKLEFYQNG